MEWASIQNIVIVIVILKSAGITIGKILDAFGKNKQGEYAHNIVGYLDKIKDWLENHNQEK